jgi:MarR family transcriptional regulator, lower aerobic nicotinate degradation pathway regulator
MQDFMSRTTLPRKTSTAAGQVGEQSDMMPSLSQRPGYLIRRLHQIHTALFAEECGEEKITPIMFSVISSLERAGPIDQTTLAQLVAIDKTNVADLLERLQRRGLVRRRVLATDRRVRIAALTAKGVALLRRIEDRVERAHERTIEDLPARDQARFVAMMSRIVDAKTQDPDD